MKNQFEIPKPGRVQYEMDKSGVVHVKEGVFQKVNLRPAEGIEVTHPDGSVEMILGAKIIKADEVGDIEM